MSGGASARDEGRGFPLAGQGGPVKRTPGSGIETAGYLTLAACLGIVLFTIFGANLIVVPGVLWLVIAWRERRRPDVPSFFLPLLVLAAWTLVSCAFSADPLESFK